METFTSDSGDAYMTVSSAPPKRRAGRTKFRETRHPVYKGVRRRNADRWVCEVREPNKKSRIWLGTFPTAEMAARAHDVAAIALRGRAATLNFADSAWLLPVPESTSPRDIQKAAAEAAERFRPMEAGDALRGDSAEMVARAGSSAENGTYYMENEIEFGMQGYLDMAEGMLIDPPPAAAQYSDGESEVDVPLWNYSF